MGNVEGRSFLSAFGIKRNIKTYVNVSSKRVSLSIGPPTGEAGWVYFPGTFLDPENIRI